jgi:hypothetical protein
MKKNIGYSWMIAVLLLILSSCTKPLGPEEPKDEPDTAKSYLRINVYTPNVNELWELKNKDTLSSGIVGGILSNGQAFSRTGVPIWQSIGAMHTISSSKNYFALGFVYAKNLTYTTYRNQANALDSLRAWNKYNLYLSFTLPTSFKTPITLDTLTNLDWFEYQVSEKYVPPSNPNATAWYIQDLYSTIVTVRYSLAAPELNDILYKSNVVQVSFTIDKYDREKKRIFGRFSFKVIGSINKEVIELRDGVFENVRVLMR